MTNDLSESLKWRANPIGVIAGAAYALHSAFAGKGEAKQYRCGNCDAYAIYCGLCKETTAISSRKRHQDNFKCPACGGDCRVFAV